MSILTEKIETEIPDERKQCEAVKEGVRSGEFEPAAAAAA